MIYQKSEWNKPKNEPQREGQRKTSVEKNIELREQANKLGTYSTLNPHLFIPIEIDNEFLENVLLFEKSPIKPVREFLNVKLKDFPAGTRLDDDEIDHQLVKLEKLLNDHDIIVTFLDRVPERIAYRRIRKFLSEKVVIVPGLYMCFDGCGRVCNKCWQLKWCKIGMEMIIMSEL